MKRYFSILFLISCLKSKSLTDRDIFKSSEVKGEISSLKDEDNFETVDKLNNNLAYKIFEEDGLSKKIVDKKINEIFDILLKNKELLIEIREEIRSGNFNEIIKKSSLDLDTKNFISQSQTAKKVKKHMREKFVAFFVKVFENEIDIPSTVLKVRDIIPSYFTKINSSKFSSYLYDQYYDYKKTEDEIKSSLESFISADIKSLIDEELSFIYLNKIDFKRGVILKDESTVILEIIDGEVFIEGFKVKLKEHREFSIE